MQGNSDIDELGLSIPEPAINDKRLIAWQCSPVAPLIRVAKAERNWMEKANKRFPYRCLPLVIANTFGWDIINPVSFSAYWDGGPAPGNVKIKFPTNKTSIIPTAHFGEGVLTFTLSHLFQTPPGINLYVKGIPNEPKDGIIPLEGIVETDNSPATFTMNYRFTRPNFSVTFEAGESYCRIFPVPRFLTEKFDPEIRMLDENIELNTLHQEWRLSRDRFNKGLHASDPVYAEKGWQKEYFQGGGQDWPKFPEHQTKLHQKEFLDFRSDDIKKRDLIPDESLQSMVLKGPNGRLITVFVSK